MKHMRSITLTLLIGLLTACVPALTTETPPAEAAALVDTTCPPGVPVLTQWMDRMEKQPQDPNNRLMKKRIVGTEAAKFIAALNKSVPSTSFEADAVTLYALQRGDQVLVGLSLGPCLVTASPAHPDLVKAWMLGKVSTRGRAS